MSTIKLLSVIEATTVTGPAKVLLEFYRSACDTQAPGTASASSAQASSVSAGTHSEEAARPQVNTSIVTFHRRRKDENPSNTDKAPNHFVAVAREAGLKVDVIDERFRFDTRVIHGLRHIVERFNPDIIESHHVKSHFLIRSSSLWQQRPWIAYHHGYTMTDFKMDVYNQLDRWSLRGAQGIITVSNAAARDLARLGLPKERIHALHNAISPDWNAGDTVESANTLKNQLGIKEGEQVVIAIGRLSKEKAQIDLVTAFSHLQQMHPNIKARLVLVGDGPERPLIEQTVASLGLQDRVIFAGQMNDVRAFYGFANVMALPSLSEGSPMVLLEAMAAGVPVVATSVGGIPEIVTHNESALLVKARDAKGMGEALAAVLTDTQLAQRLAAKAREVVVSRHSPEANLQARLAIYQNVLRNAKL